MTLNSDEKALLGLIAKSPAPVAMSDFFNQIHPPVPEMGEEGPEREEWTELQIGLYGASIDLHDKGLVRIVEPANGERPDLVEATLQGHVALDAAS